MEIDIKKGSAEDIAKVLEVLVVLINDYNQQMLSELTENSIYSARPVDIINQCNKIFVHSMDQILHALADQTGEIRIIEDDGVK